MSSNEYSKPTVGNAGCTYAKLDNTYACNGQAGLRSAKMNQYVVPKLCPGSGKNTPAYPPPYNTLQHGFDNTCGGNFSFKQAYPYSSCTDCKLEFTTRDCNGNMTEQCKPPAPPASQQRRQRRQNFMY